MKTISAALKAHLAQPYQNCCVCWLCVRKDGTVLAVSDHDVNLVFDLEAAMTALGLTPPAGISGTGSQTYLAASGFTASNINTGAGLNVDTGEAQGVLVSPSITEDDLLAGLWDYAAITIFLVNWADLTQGAMLLRSGHIGQVTTDRGFFKAEWRGKTQAYSRNIGELDSPTCRAWFGDSRCKKSLAGYTVTGTLTGVGADNRTCYDPARTEPGPTGGVAITAITKANPGIVTMASAGTFKNGDVVSISGVTGMTQVNTMWRIQSLSGTSWSLGVNTSSYPARTGGGTVTPMAGSAGYFGYGLCTFTAGANAGLSMEVQNSVPGQWVLRLPMPYALAPGDAYTLIAGCDKELATCRDTYHNILNFRGEPFLPGIDRAVQVGRSM